MKTSKPKGAPKPYGFEYQNAVIEAGELMALKFGPMSVLKCLVKHCNGETGQAYPSKDTLAALGGQGLRTVKRHLRTLEGVGLIEPFAYATGGHGRSTVYKFGLPTWAKPRAPKNGAKMAWLTVCRETYGANLSSYRAILSSYRANSAPQQRRTEEEKGDSAPAGRGEGGETLKGFTFAQLVTAEGYAGARRLWDEWTKEALRAAENEEGEKSEMEYAQ